MTNWSGLHQISQQIKFAASTYYTSLVQPTAAHTKGNYVEISSSIPFDSEGLVMSFLSTSYGSNNLFDIAIGAAASEVDIISNVLAPHSTAYQLGRKYVFPLKIKAGTRLSGRSQGSYGGVNNFRISTHLLAGSWSYNRGFAVCDTYGANTGDSGGASIDPGTSAGTKGSWVQLSSGISRDIKGLVLCLGGYWGKSSSSYYWNVDIGVGAVSSEKVIFSNWSVSTHSGGSQIFPNATPFLPIHIPIGTRIAVRAACNGTAATNRLVDAILHTFS